VSGIIHWLQGVQGAVAYTVIAALVFGEAAVFIGFVLPGETAVLIGGVLAATGRLQLPVLLVLVVLAAVLGDTVGYEVGRHLGPRALASRPLRGHHGRIEGAQGFLRRRGGTAVFLGRWTAFLRAVMPGLAGMSRMPYPRFLFFNASGGLLWGVAVALLGFFAGNSYSAVANTLGRTSAVILAVLVLAVLVVWHRARRRKARESAAEEDPRSPAEGRAGGPGGGE
jgi:membrane protein DedA with SNARE-associated domain